MGAVKIGNRRRLHIRMETALRFDFGPVGAECPEGYRKITPDTRYGPAAGYGFTQGRVYARDRGGPARPAQDFCIPLDAEFAVDLPDGIYQVTVTAGDPWTETETAVKAQEGRLMLERLQTAAGHTGAAVFSVWVTGGRLRLQFGGAVPRVNALEIVPRDSVLTVFLAGDSTVCDQPAEGWPYAGWGQMLPARFKADVAVANYAVSGRSSKSFLDEGRLDPMLERMKRDDVLLIQFAHNDEKADPERHTEPSTSYREHLLRYVDAARSSGAVPVLVTPVERRYFDKDGMLLDTHGEYPQAMRELAREERVPLVDLTARSRELFERLGPEATKDLFLWSFPGEYRRHPLGVQDNTHFHERGARKIAELVAEGLRELDLPQLRLFFR